VFVPEANGDPIPSGVPFPIVGGIVHIGVGLSDLSRVFRDIKD
jgi:hypothetical protein